MRNDTRLPLGRLQLELGSPAYLFAVRHADQAGDALVVEGPVFKIDGQDRGNFVFDRQMNERTLARGGREVTLRYRAAGTPDLELDVVLRAYADSPVLRFRYVLTATAAATLTKRDTRDRLRYLTLRGAGVVGAALTEIQLSHFDPVAHSYMPNVETRGADDVYAGLSFAGPIAILHTPERSALLAYEHGADHPNSFLRFGVERREAGPALGLAARTGNYFHGQALGPGVAWESVWFELALMPAPLDALLQRYRAFFLEEISDNLQSRRPYLFYNTWNHQERQKYFHNRPYLESMHYERIAAEIDVAHRLGIDVFVIDTGWYQKTGDWEVDTERFPDGLREIKRKLDEHGMKLGLWFNPTVAAVSSRIFREHPEYAMTRGDNPPRREPIWETEESVSMCLASDYAQSFIETMVRLHHELGVSYFKWDAIGQYGCDSPLHQHGTAANTREERGECYAYQMGRQMIRIVEEVSRQAPEIIVDFDITEGGRFVGLGFLSAGKYFLMNNGPYFRDFDIPATTKIDPDTINVFFYPGPARPRICRQGIKYDAVIPSILFLTHFLPDPPALSQRNSVAALVLGGNGIWGDLLSLDEADIGLLAGELGLYKQVAEGVTRAYPRVRGFIGASPEIYEKIDPARATGVVVFFTVARGTFTHVTQPMATGMVRRVAGADAWELLPDNRIKISVTLERNDARVVYVLGETNEG